MDRGKGVGKKGRRNECRMILCGKARERKKRITREEKSRLNGRNRNNGKKN